MTPLKNISSGLDKGKVINAQYSAQNATAINQGPAVQLSKGFDIQEVCDIQDDTSNDKAVSRDFTLKKVTSAHRRNDTNLNQNPTAEFKGGSKSGVSDLNQTRETVNNLSDKRINNYGGIAIQADKDPNFLGLDTPQILQAQQQQQISGQRLRLRSPDRLSMSASNCNYINGAAADVYENEDMADYFMEDMDEMSICEGSRQSQQEFHYNATGHVNRIKGASFQGQRTKDFGGVSSLNMTLNSSRQSGSGKGLE